MEQFKKTVDRKTGNCVKVPKAHRMINFPKTFIAKFGAPSGRLQHWTPHNITQRLYPKKTAQRTQKQFQMINQQTTTCYYENHIIDVAHSRMYNMMLIGEEGGNSNEGLTTMLSEDLVSPFMCHK
jgi:hypothetical protein